MSRIVNIKGSVVIQNINLALESVKECGLDVKIENNRFVFNEYDYNDGQYKKGEIQKVEILYTQKFNVYIENAEIEEKKRVEEEKRIIREEKADLIIENAKKKGYKLKKEIREDNTIKLILQQRIY